MIEGGIAIGPNRAANNAIEMRLSKRLARSAIRLALRWCLPIVVGGFSFQYLFPTSTEAVGTWLLPVAALADAHPLATVVGLCTIAMLVLSYWFPEPPGPPLPAIRRGRFSWLDGLLLGGLLLILASGRAALGIYTVENASMLPTMEPYDTVGGLRFAHATVPWRGPMLPARGDIIVFRKPAGVDGPSFLVKRVVGLPGDRISMKGVVPVINGKPVGICEAGPYLYPLSHGGAVAGRVFVEFLGQKAHLGLYVPGADSWAGTYDVKPGEVFVLGDNRSNSNDSRAWDRGKGAGVPLTTIDGKVERRLIELDRNLHVDLRRSSRPLELDVSVDGIDTAFVRDGVRACLSRPPKAD